MEINPEFGAHREWGEPPSLPTPLPAVPPLPACEPRALSSFCRRISRCDELLPHTAGVLHFPPPVRLPHSALTGRSSRR